MLNRTLRLAISTGLLIAIISFTPGSAIDFSFQGRFVLSDAIGENNLLFRSVSSSRYIRGPDVPPNHLFTFEKTNRMLRLVSRPSHFRAHLALASSDMTMVKKVYTLSDRQPLLKQVQIQWDQFYPNLCLIGTDAHDNPDPWEPRPHSFVAFDRFRERNGLGPITSAGSVPKYQIISFAVNFAFEGVWSSIYQANRHAAAPTSFLHHSIDNKYVLRLENQKILTLCNPYSRAFVALVNAEKNMIKSIFVLKKLILDRVPIPFSRSYPNLCLLRADQGEEDEGGPNPKTFNDHQDWLGSIHSAAGAFIGNPPINVPTWNVRRIANQ